MQSNSLVTFDLTLRSSEIQFQGLLNQNKIKNIFHRSFMKFDIVAIMVDPVGNKVQVPWFVDLRISMFFAKIL